MTGVLCLGMGGVVWVGISTSDFGMEIMDIDTVGAYSNYGNLVRPLNVSKGNLQHWVLGKIVIP